MARVNKQVSNSNIIYEYELEWTNNRGAVIEWLERVCQYNGISVRKILLDNMSDRSDEQVNSVVLGKIMGKYNLYKLCNERNIDVVSIVAKQNESPVIIGADFRDNRLFITLRKNKMADYEKLEKEFNLL